MTTATLDDFYRDVVRVEACAGTAEILRAVETLATTAQWPQATPAIAFWSRARVETALEYARLALPEQPRLPAAPSERPAAPGEALALLLGPCWEQLTVDYWLSDNLADHVYQDSYGVDEEAEREFERWLAEVAAGKYIRRL